MNVPVIANDLVTALRKVSPAARTTASASTVHKNQIVVLVDYQDALRLIDFIEENTPPTPRVNQRQGQLFDPAGY